MPVLIEGSGCRDWGAGDAGESPKEKDLPSTQVGFVVEPVPPFRLDLTAWLLRRRPNNALDLWDTGTYRRLIVTRDGLIELSVRQRGPAEAPRLDIEARGEGAKADLRRAAKSVVERLLGIGIDLSDFYRVAAEDPLLARLVERFRGAKPPRYPTVFEALTNGICCQQITLTLGLSILNRLAESFGPVVNAEGICLAALPTASTVAGLDPDALRRVGFSRQKAESLIAAGRAVTAGELDLEKLAVLDNDSAGERLRGLRGVGRWTSDYVLLRGLGRTEIFPRGDAGGRNGLQRWLGSADKLDEASVRGVVARWQPYGGLVYFHLLLAGAVEKGWLSVGTEADGVSDAYLAER